MNNGLGGLSEAGRRQLVEAPYPGWMDAMLATPTHNPFSDPGWLYERKLDGERCLVFRHDRSVRLMSRNRQGLSPTYPELADALAGTGADRFVADGEIVAFAGNVTSFSKFQGRMGIHAASKARQSPIRVYCYLLDVLYLVPFPSDIGVLNANVTTWARVRGNAHRAGNGPLLMLPWPCQAMERRPRARAVTLSPAISL